MKLFIGDENLKRDIARANSATHRVAGNLEVRTVRNAVFDPSLGLFEDGKPLVNSFPLATNGKKILRQLEASGFNAPGAGKVHAGDGSPLFYLGCLNACWGHLLIDCARYLWPVVEGRLPANTKFVYSILPGPNWSRPEKIVDNYAKLLAAVGIDPSRMIRVEEPTRFAELLMGDECFMKDEASPVEHFYAPEAKAMYERVSEILAPGVVKPFRKVFLSRGQWKACAKDIGEDRLVEVFRKHGDFEIVSPERLSLEEMVRLLRETKVLVATCGSLAHNAVFCQSGTELVLLYKINHVNTYQEMIDEMRGLEVVHVEANRTDTFVKSEHAWMGPFHLEVTDQVAKYLGCRAERPIKPRLKYLYLATCRQIRRMLKGEG